MCIRDSLWNALLGDVGADQFYTGATALGLLHVALVLAGVALLSSSVRGVEASVLAAAEGGDSYLDVASKSRAYAVAGWTLLLLNSAWAAADGLTLAWSGCRVVEAFHAFELKNEVWTKALAGRREAGRCLSAGDPSSDLRGDRRRQRIPVGKLQT